MAEKIFMKGCEAVAETAVRAGCRFFAGYPITPQNDVPEYFARRMPQVGGVFIQGESEVASANMAFGAAAAGVRSMTSSSSCGISLKSEAISWMAGARLPVVVANFQRGGPGIGTIQPAQQDYTRPPSQRQRRLQDARPVPLEPPGGCGHDPGRPSSWPTSTRTPCCCSWTVSPAR